MKLQQYGIDGKTSNWIASLLRGRRQRVIVNGTGSAWSPVLSGVPQGTVIGPILLLIYINDITCDINSRMRLFADDSIIYWEIHIIEDRYKLQDDITKLQSWSERWQMTFKPEECYVLSITNKRNIGNFLYHINDVALESKDSWKYLGVIYRLQAELERPLHRDICKSPSSTRTDPAHPTCSYTEMQGNRLQSARPSALGIRIYCMERPHCQEHQAPRRHPKQCSTICTSQIRLEHQCYGPQARPQLAYTSTTPQNPRPHHVVQDTLRLC